MRLPSSVRALLAMEATLWAFRHPLAYGRGCRCGALVISRDLLGSGSHALLAKWLRTKITEIWPVGLHGDFTPRRDHMAAVDSVCRHLEEG